MSPPSTSSSRSSSIPSFSSFSKSGCSPSAAAAPPTPPPRADERSSQRPALLVASPPIDEMAVHHEPPWASALSSARRRISSFACRTASSSIEARRLSGGSWWTAISSMGGEATKSAGRWLLRSSARGGGVGGAAAAEGEQPDFEKLEKEGMDDDRLLEVLGGDMELAQGFLFLPQAFLGCDWNGLIHVSVQHDGGTHLVTLVVTPQGPRLLQGHLNKAPMLTVLTRREVLLDILEGKLDATRAVVSRKVTVSDLSKLIVFKSAFRFKRAVWEAFRSTQRAKRETLAGNMTQLDAAKQQAHAQQAAAVGAQPPPAQPQPQPQPQQEQQRQQRQEQAAAPVAAPEVAPPPSATSEADAASGSAEAASSPAAAPTAVEPTPEERAAAAAATPISIDATVLELLRDDSEFVDAVAFVLAHAFLGSEMSVGAMFRVSGFEGGTTRQVAIGASPDGCAVLAGERIGEVTITCTVDCAREPLLQILRGEVEPLMALSTGQVQVDDLGQLMAWKCAFRFERPEFNAYISERRRLAAEVEPTPEERAAAAAATPISIDATVLELLRDDSEFVDAVAFVLAHAFLGSEMSVGAMFRVSGFEGGTTRQVAIGASPDGCAVLAGERIGEVTITCTVDCAREPLLQILRGEVEPLMALSTGQVQVDDLGQLMAWKCAFRFERPEFNAYISERRRLAATDEAPPQ
eukprot:Transcript_11383.p1 GENE.Transcript_11383~~Transcript_11383.p1  ORF type:complete len:692 (+),score=278.41 Transcript_11383:474-2549(+)